VFSSGGVDLAKRCIIDGLGVMVAGMREPSYRSSGNTSIQQGAPRRAQSGRGKERAPAQLAALVNGIAGHAMDWDDTALSTTPDRGVLLHPTVHPWQQALR